MQGWKLSFADVLTLLLTVFVAVLALQGRRSVPVAVSSEQGEGPGPAEKMPLFPLIRDLHRPDLGPRAREMVLGLFDQFAQSFPGGEGAVMNEDHVVLLISDALLYPSGRSEVGEEVRERMHALVPWLNQVNGEIRIVGHCDDQPGRDNRSLSWERARGVARILAAEGVPGERLVLVGAGARQPVADNRTREGRARNRRVEIHVYLNRQSLWG